jgi:hypothetical protein
MNAHPFILVMMSGQEATLWRGYEADGVSHSAGSRPEWPEEASFRGRSRHMDAL